VRLHTLGWVSCPGVRPIESGPAPCFWRYPNPTAAAEVIAKRNGVGAETVRRLWVQSQIDGGQRRGATTEELAEIRDLKAKVRRLEEDNDILRRASVFFAGELDPRNR